MTVFSQPLEDNKGTKIVIKPKSYLSFSLQGNDYNSGCMTWEKDTVTDSVSSANFQIPYPFSSLDIRRENSSSGRCWMFYLDVKGTLLGCLFPSGYRLYGYLDNSLILGRFFLENRNIVKQYNGLASAVIPQKPVLGLNPCHFILTNKLREDEMGNLILTYNERNKVKECHYRTTEQKSQ